MTPVRLVLALVSLPLLTLSISAGAQGIRQADNSASESSRIQIGLKIAPVPLEMAGKNPALVGLGSYIVNAQAGCAGCHSNPEYAEGGDPHFGQDEELSASTYLSGGGTNFGPFVPRNITPNSAGRPAGLTLERFLEVINTGADLKGRAPFVPSLENDLLQAMPWPVYQKMTDREKVAIYEYLTAIPCIPGIPDVPATGSPTRCD